MWTIETKDCKLKIERLGPIYAAVQYRVVLVSGTWPPKDKLVKLCDPLSLGGRVQWLENSAIVTAYTD